MLLAKLFLQINNVINLITKLKTNIIETLIILNLVNLNK